MRRRHLFVGGPLFGVLVVVGALILLTPVEPDGAPSLTFTLEGEDGEVVAPIEPAVLRRRTITPEFDPPLELRAGRVVFARGGIACDPGEVYRVDVELTQGEAHATGRTAGRCTGDAQTWQAVVVARGGATFAAGPAHACAVATTRRQGITDSHEWCADPVLAPAD